MRLILFMTLILSFSCGTETGNPFDGGNASNQVGYPEDNDEPSEGTLQILREVCSKLNDCFSVNNYDCEVSIFGSVDGFDSKYSIPVTDYSIYKDIYLAEKNNDLTVNDGNLATCIADIKTLSCGSVNVTTAYSNSSPNDYSNSSAVIPLGPGSCQDTFDVSL
jgi:hypothetical protein